MIKALAFALTFSCLALVLSRSSFGQENLNQSAVVVAESGNRAQDKLKGPVRRVRVETARIIPKDGAWVEGPREVLAITTYEPAGRKIDSLAYPLSSGLPRGKEHHVYDERGNVVEMILLSADGSMLSKESYKYEFDQLGNWTKMSSSVAVYENGKVIFEPTAITYRIISYYYTQAIEKIKPPLTKSKGSAATSTSTLLPDANPASKDSKAPSTPIQLNTTNQPLSGSVHTEAKMEPVAAPALTAPTRTSTMAEESEVASSSEIRETPTNTPATNIVRRVSEDDLRKAAIELPQPEYSEAALLARASGRVEVQILVDEDGNVTNAQATSGHPLLGAAAEAAARKARFSLAKVSAGAPRIYGVIGYEFVPPRAMNEATTTISPTIEANPPKAADRKPMEASTETAVVVESKPGPAANYSEAANSFYDKGVAFQAAGRFAEAAEAFNQTIKVNPNDAKAYARLGMAYSALLRHQDAIVVYKMAIQADKSVLGGPAYYMLGHSYLALEKSSDALSAFKQALAITRAETIDPGRKETPRYPSLEQLHYGMGIAYLNSRRFSNSIDELKHVLRLNPKHAEAHYTIAIAYLSNGNRRDAEKHYKTLSSLDAALAKKITSALVIGGLAPRCLNFACR